MTILNNNVWGNITVTDLIQDAQKALDVLIQQPEIDSNKISLIGYSEGKQ
jgi:dienelactone hydrolase